MGSKDNKATSHHGVKEHGVKEHDVQRYTSKKFNDVHSLKRLLAAT